MLGIALFWIACLVLFACVLPFVSHNRVRNSFVATYLGIALFVWGTTETLSLFNSICRPAVLAVWSLLIFGCIVFFIKKGCITAWKDLLGRPMLQSILREKTGHKWLIIPIAWIAVFSFLGAILYAPTTFDAMTYHMTRIMHWLQNRNLSYLLCNDERLNYQLPLAEYFIMHFQLLLKSDYLAGLVQWNAFIASLLTISLIAAEFGLNKKIQVISMFIMATTPNIILQSHSTQNDLVVCSYLLIFILFMVKLLRGVTTCRIVMAGIAMGLSLMAKGTAFLYIAIIGFSFGIWILIKARKEWLKTAFKCLGIVAIGLLLLTPVFIRNYNHYQTLLPASPQNEPYFLRSFQGNEPIMAFMRSVSLHLGLPFNNWNAMIQNHFIDTFGKEFITSVNAKLPVNVTFKLDQDCIGNFFHLFFFLISFVVLFYSAIRNSFIRRRNKSLDNTSSLSMDYEITFFSVISLVAMVVMCASLCYSPWRARYHVPFFAMFSISIAYIIYKVRNRALRTAIYIFLFGCALYVLHNDHNNPLDYRTLKKTSLSTIKENHKNYVTLKFSQQIMLLKEFLIKNKINKINFYNAMNQRDYPILRFLGGPIQDEIRVNRVVYEKETNYEIPYILFTNFDKIEALKYLQIPGKLIFSTKNLLLFDLSQEPEPIEVPSSLSDFEVLKSIYIDKILIDFVVESYKVSTDYIFTIKQPHPENLYINIINQKQKYKVTCFSYYFNGVMIEENQTPIMEGNSVTYSLKIPGSLISKMKSNRLKIEMHGENGDLLIKNMILGRKNQLYSKITFSDF